MANFGFKSNYDLMAFILNTPDLGTWPVTYVSIQTVIGLRLNLGTQINDPNGQDQYARFARIANLLDTFVRDNDVNGASVDIRLMADETVRGNIDPNGYFNALNANLYSNNGIVMIVTTAYAAVPMAPSTVSQQWDAYVGNLIANWRNALKG